MNVKLDWTVHAVVFILLTVVSFGCGHAGAHSDPLQVCVLGNKTIIHIFALGIYFSLCSVTFPLKSKRVKREVCYE